MEMSIQQFENNLNTLIEAKIKEGYALGKSKKEIFDELMQLKEELKASL